MKVQFLMHLTNGVELDVTTHLTLTLGVHAYWQFHLFAQNTEWKSLDWKRINLKFMACEIQSQIIHVILTHIEHLYFFENKFVGECFGFGNEGSIDISNILWLWASIWFKCKEEKLSFYLCVQALSRQANLG